MTAVFIVYYSGSRHGAQIAEALARWKRGAA